MPQCAAAFGLMSHLTRHVRAMHEKRKDHACPHCAAAFGQANNLTTHVRTVHEKRRDHACPHYTSTHINLGVRECVVLFNLAEVIRCAHVRTE